MRRRDFIGLTMGVGYAGLSGCVEESGRLGASNAEDIAPAERPDLPGIIYNNGELDTVTFLDMHMNKLENTSFTYHIHDSVLTEVDEEKTSMRDFVCFVDIESERLYTRDKGRNTVEVFGNGRNGYRKVDGGIEERRFQSFNQQHDMLLEQVKEFSSRGLNGDLEVSEPQHHDDEDSFEIVVTGGQLDSAHETEINDGRIEFTGEGIISYLYLEGSSIFAGMEERYLEQRTEDIGNTSVEVPDWAD